MWIPDEIFMKKFKNHMDMDKQCGDYWGEGSTRGLNGNGKNTIKIKNLKISIIDIIL